MSISVSSVIRAVLTVAVTDHEVNDLMAQVCVCGRDATPQPPPALRPMLVVLRHSHPCAHRPPGASSRNAVRTPVLQGRNEGGGARAVAEYAADMAVPRLHVPTSIVLQLDGLGERMGVPMVIRRDRLLGRPAPVERDLSQLLVLTPACAFVPYLSGARMLPYFKFLEHATAHPGLLAVFDEVRQRRLDPEDRAAVLERAIGACRCRRGLCVLFRSHSPAHSPARWPHLRPRVGPLVASAFRRGHRGVCTASTSLASVFHSCRAGLPHSCANTRLCQWGYLPAEGAGPIPC